MAGSAADHASFLPPILVFCAAAVVAVPLFRKMGLSAVIGYLAAGLVIGPWGLRLVAEPDTIRVIAEIGVVLLLFIVGLELKVSHLVSMRRDIFGLGAAQMVCCAALIGLGAYFILQLPPLGAGIAGIALSLSATAIALQLLDERGELHTPYGERTFAVLLFQDLSIAPILALVPLLAGAGLVAESGAAVTGLMGFAKAAGAIGLVILIGRYGLNPFFDILARADAREVMTAAALFVVLGAALLMDKVGLSMAMGAFLAGVLLAESDFRHQLEADIEPFRGVLLGLFFISVGMSLDAGLVMRFWPLILLGAPALILIKIAVSGALVRLFGSRRRDSLRASVLLAPAGEFAFVLLPLGLGSGLLSSEQAGLVTALAAITMLLGPLAAKAVDMLLARRPVLTQAMNEDFAGAGGSVLVIGFGRFGQVLTQVLLAKGLEVTVIDRDVESIRTAARFGFKVYYGDGARRDVLRAAGAGKARIVCVCIGDKREATGKILDQLRTGFPQAARFVSVYDRLHALDVMDHDVDFFIRETFESALAFGRAALQELGVMPEEAEDIVEDVRRRDGMRLMKQKAEGMMGGVNLLHGRKVQPEPLTQPQSPSKALSPETQDILRTPEPVV